MRNEGLTRFVGLTGIGHPDALAEVVRSAGSTVQTPYNVLNPSAGWSLGERFVETNYGNLMAACAGQNMGVFAIRVLAGGALAGQPASAHTRQTRFFPLDLYQRDTQRAAELADRLAGHGLPLCEFALRFALSHPHVSSAIVGFGSSRHLDEALEFVAHGALADSLLSALDLPCHENRGYSSPRGAV